MDARSVTLPAAMESFFYSLPVAALLCLLENHSPAAIVRVNQLAQELLGIRDFPPFTLQITDILAEEHPPLPQLLPGQASATMYTRLKSGTATPLAVLMKLSRLEEVKPPLLLVIIEPTALPKDLQNSLEQNRVILNSTLDGYMLLDTGGRIVEVSPSYCQMSGYRREELVGRSIREIDIQMTPRQYKTRFKQLLTEGRMRFETRHKHKSGQAIELDLSLTLLQQEGENRIAAFLRDITQSKRRHRKLQETRANLQSLIDAPDTNIWSIDNRYRYLIFNKSYQNTHQAVYGERLRKGMNALRPLPPQIRSFWKEKYDQALQGERVNFEFRETIRGKEVIHDVFLNPIRIRQSIVGVSAICFDVTRRKIVEAALKESEERFRLAFYTSPDAINITRLDNGVYVDVNEGFERITGYKREEVIGKSSLEIQIWDNPRDRQRLVEELQKKGHVENLEARYRLKDGRVQTGLMSATLIQLHNEPHILSITRQIEHIKQLEEQQKKLLEESEAARKLLHDVFERMTDGVVALDTNWRYTYLNTQAAKMLNRQKPEDLLGKHIWTEYPEGIDQPFYRAYYRAMETQQPIYLEEYFEPWDRWFENRIYPSPEGITIYFTEITERKKAERALKDSEERYRYLFDNSPVPLWEQDFTEVDAYLSELSRQGITDEKLNDYFDANPEKLRHCLRLVKILKVNRAALKFNGAKSRDDLLKNLKKLVTPQALQAFKNQLLCLASGSDRYETETVVKTIDGRLRHIYLHFSRLAPEEEKRTLRAIVATLDITPLKETQWALEQRLHELQQLYNLGVRISSLKETSTLIREALVVIGTAVQADLVLFFRIKEGTLQLEAQYSPRTQLQVSKSELVHMEECLCGLSAARGETIFSSDICKDIRCTRKSCKQVGVRSFAALPLNFGKEIIGVIGLASTEKRDFAEHRYFLETLINETAVGLQNTLLLEELKRHEAELERLVDQRTRDLREALEELEHFSYSVSHDLRAPLRAIDGFSRILAEEYVSKLDEEAKRLIQVVRNNARRMGELIDDLLDFSRVGRQALKPTRLNMNAMVRSVLDNLTGSQKEQKADIKTETLPAAFADGSLLRQVWQNLLSNALKFSAGRPRPQIWVGAREEANQIIYFVKDNGVGFDMKYADKLFQIFQRLHSAEEFEGTGVGLSIVQRIVTRHGGRVWAESQPEQGATFYFSLPKIPLVD